MAASTTLPTQLTIATGLMKNLKVWFIESSAAPTRKNKVKILKMSKQLNLNESEMLSDNQANNDDDDEEEEDEEGSEEADEMSEKRIAQQLQSEMAENKKGKCILQ
jgi:hypothetical protein